MRGKYIKIIIKVQSWEKEPASTSFHCEIAFSCKSPKKLGISNCISKKKISVQAYAQLMINA